MSKRITDSDRLRFIADKMARVYGTNSLDWVASLDAQIKTERGRGQVNDTWIDLTVAFPDDEVLVVVQASDGVEGAACYNAIEGDFYLNLPGTALHGRLWNEAFGPHSEILRWRAGNQ